MEIKKSLIKIFKFIGQLVSFIIFEIIILFALYIALMYPVKSKYLIISYRNDDNKNSYIYNYYNNKVLVEEEKQMIIARLKNINMFEIDELQMDAISKIIISVNERHKKAGGAIILTGQYESLEKFEEILSLMEIKRDKFSDDKSYTSVNDYIGITNVKIKNENKFTITINVEMTVSTLPIDGSSLREYFLDINEKNGVKIQKQFVEAWIAIGGLMLIINVSCFVGYSFLKKSN